MSEILSSYDVVSKRRIFKGPTDSYRGITPVNYSWAKEVWKLMLANTWFPEEVNLTADANSYSDLRDGEKQAYSRALAFLANLDSIQLHNLSSNILPHVTAPEIEQCIHRQVFEEQLHVESYSLMVESVALNAEEVYFMPMRDEILKAKNEAVMAQGEMLKTGDTGRNLLLACVANIILEGIYFYTGFALFYALARAGKMINSSTLIKFINRDEIVHLHLFINILQVASREMGIPIASLKEEIYELFDKSVKLEQAWGKHVIEGGILGLTDGLVDEYVKFLANDRLGMIGLEPLYTLKGDKRPLAWIEDFSRVNGSSVAFFERRATDYQKAVKLFD